MQMGSSERVSSDKTHLLVQDRRHQLFSCVICNESASSSKAKMLPCLHVVCEECLECHLLAQPESVNMPMKDINLFAETIFSCPRCLFKTQLPRTGVAGLKAAFFVSNSGEIEGPKQDDNGNLWMAGTDKLASPQQQLDEERPGSLYLNQSPNVDGVALTKLRIKKLMRMAEQVKTDGEVSLIQLESAKRNSEDSTASLRSSIVLRADRLCQLVLAQRDHLLAEVDKHHNSAQCRFESTIGDFSAQIETIEYCLAVSDSVFHSCQVDGVNQVLDDVSARIGHVAGGTSSSQSMRRGQNIPEISALRLAIPDAGFEDSHLEKLFGTLVAGTIGNVELIMSFNTELHWPSAHAVSRTRNSVLVGKTGAFSTSGRLIFYDRHGVCMDSVTLEPDRLPVDLVAVSDGCVLMSDVSGRISKYSSSGHILTEWPDKFRGASGRMAAASNLDGSETVLVTSAIDNKIHRYNTSDGTLVDEFTLVWKESDVKLEPSAVTTNSSGDILVTSSKSSAIYIFNRDGTPQHCYGQPCDRSNSSSASALDVHGIAGKKPEMHLLSSLCCDPFDNILVADFVANCVHLWSRSGRYLGRLLSERDGISCPNLVSLDHDGRLYVGQYGGEVLVFQYLNFTKKI